MPDSSATDRSTPVAPPFTAGESGHRCSECPDCGPSRPWLKMGDHPRVRDIECAAAGCEGVASLVDPYCTPECAEGRCPNCGQPRTAMVCAPDECKP